MSRINPNYPVVQKIEVFTDHPVGTVVRFSAANDASISICSDPNGTFPIERIQRALDELKSPQIKNEPAQVYRGAVHRS